MEFVIEDKHFLYRLFFFIFFPLFWSEISNVDFGSFNWDFTKIILKTLMIFSKNMRTCMLQKIVKELASSTCPTIFNNFFCELATICYE